MVSLDDYSIALWSILSGPHYLTEQGNSGAWTRALYDRAAEKKNPISFLKYCFTDYGFLRTVESIMVVLDPETTSVYFDQEGECRSLGDVVLSLPTDHVYDRRCVPGALLKNLYNEWHVGGNYGELQNDDSREVLASRIG